MLMEVTIVIFQIVKGTASHRSTHPRLDALDHYQVRRPLENGSEFYRGFDQFALAKTRLYAASASNRP